MNVLLCNKGSLEEGRNKFSIFPQSATKSQKHQIDLKLENQTVNVDLPVKNARFVKMHEVQASQRGLSRQMVEFCSGWGAPKGQARCQDEGSSPVMEVEAQRRPPRERQGRAHQLGHRAEQSFTIFS